MATEECAICGDSVPFGTTTHVLVNPKHEDEVADHYVCRPCYDEHLEGLFVALEVDEGGDGLEEDEAPTGPDGGTDESVEEAVEPASATPDGDE